MEQIGLLVRAILRARWGALVMTGVLAGLIGGGLMVSLAVARRTSTAWERLAEATHAEDVRVTSALGVEATEQLTELPQISESWVGDAMIGQVAGDPIRYLSVMAGPSRGPDLHHPILIDGRAADPDDPHELTVDEQFAEQSGFGLGDELTVDFLTYDEFLLFDEGFDEPDGPSVPFRIVGVTREPAPQAGLAPVEATPAFSRRYVPDRRVQFMRARLRHGADDLPAFRREVAELGRAVTASDAGRDPQASEVPAFDVSVPRESAESVHEAARVLVSGLLVAAAVAALAGGTAVIQVLIRRHAADEGNRRIESALGLTFADQLRARLVTGALAAAVAALTSCAIAWAASGIAPLGSVGGYEPAPGAAPNLVVLTAGPVVVLGLVLLLDAFAFLVVARPGRRRPLTRRSQVAAIASGTSPAVDVGVDLAFDRRRSRAAIAVRSARIGAVIGVAGVALTIVFAASLQRLADTPARWGWQADVAVVDTRPKIVDDLLSDGRVLSLAEVETNAVRVDGNEVPASAYTVRRGQLGWTMVEGRAPSSPDEVAIGARYADELGVGIDDHVEIDLTDADHPGTATRRLAVVGIGLGAELERNQFGEGVLLTADGLGDTQVRAPYREAYLGLRAGTLDDFLADHGSVLEIVGPERPPEIANLADLGVLPLVLGAFLGVVAVAALANALVVATQQRRRDLGTLRAMGMSRGSVREAICVAGVSIAAVGVVVGLPLGVVLGGSVWRFVAANVHVDGDPALTWPLLVVPVAALAVGALVSLLPGRRATHHRPASMLRTD